MADDPIPDARHSWEEALQCSARHYEGSGGKDHRAAEKKIPLPACRAADGSRPMPCHHCGVLCAAQCG
ncbi:hypothetical protein V5799_008572 [Amblyomma americanum]|uniref:Uncharacterized protein n=1 Tax=Amblyomma americanum TaxID=6943 RepID=A0AAQ4FE05_AMBAM